MEGELAAGDVPISVPSRGTNQYETMRLSDIT
jgi:hypothetical protein